MCTLAFLNHEQKMVFSPFVCRYDKNSDFGSDLPASLTMNVVVFYSQHEEGTGLIEDNEINNNTLVGVWITRGINN